MTGYLEDLRGRLDGAVQSFNKVVGSFEGRVLVQARKFRDLGAAARRTFRSEEQIETAARKLDSPTSRACSNPPNGDHS